MRFFPAEFKGEHAAQVSEEKDAAERPIGGTLWSGIIHAARSPYLLGICAFMLLHAVTATLVYFQQADITARQFTDRAARTAFFAQLDIWVNVLTIVVQIFLDWPVAEMARRWPDAGDASRHQPGRVSCPGREADPSLLALFQVLRRAMNYALSRPAREVLFTGFAARRQIQSEKFHGHICLLRRRSDRRLDLSAADLARTWTDRHLLRGRATRRGLVRTQPLVRPAPESRSRGQGLPGMRLVRRTMERCP